jgi:hypothetical protein
MLFPTTLILIHMGNVSKHDMRLKSTWSRPNSKIRAVDVAHAVRPQSVGLHHDGFCPE